MTDNRTTEHLRALLDERGVEWKSGRVCNNNTSWNVGDSRIIAKELTDGTLLIQQYSRKHFTPEQAIAATLGSEINGDTSDGYHTFNELYHHRAVLFSVIVRDHRELAWKARKHHDGTMYENMFIVGIETPNGQATYHYDLDPYWEMFDCEEREYAPEWDGHTPDDAIARIAELGGDDGYEAKMDALLCRLTNGKWSKSRAYDLDFMESCVNEEFEALYSEEQFSAPVHGTLTAEQVRETVEKHWHDLPDEYDMPEATALPEYSYNWQAIADELNAELGNGTCRLHYGEDDDGYDGWYCDECSGWFQAVRRDGHLVEPKHCQECGKAVKR